MERGSPAKAWILPHQILPDLCQITRWLPQPVGYIKKTTHFILVTIAVKRKRVLSRRAIVMGMLMIGIGTASVPVVLSMLHVTSDRLDKQPLSSIPTAEQTAEISSSGQFTDPQITSQLMDNMFDAHKAFSRLNKQQLFMPIKLVQVVNGYRVTVCEVYADANRVIIGVFVNMPRPVKSIQFSSQQDFYLAYVTEQGIELTEANGAKLALMGVTTGEDARNPRHGESAVLLSFDATNIQGKPEEIALKLKIGIACSNDNWTCAKELTYSFHLPFHAGRSATPHQAVAMNGNTLTLERIALTPLEARIYIGGWAHSMFGSLQETNNTQLAKLYTVTLSLQDHTHEVCTFQDDNEPCTGEIILDYPLSTDSSVIQWGAGEWWGPPHPNNDRTIKVFSLLEQLNTTQVTVIVTRKVATLTPANNSNLTKGPLMDDKTASQWIFKTQLL